MGGSSAGSYLADPTSPIPSHCASIVWTSTVRVNILTLSGELNEHRRKEKGYSPLFKYRGSTISTWVISDSTQTAIVMWNFHQTNFPLTCLGNHIVTANPL